MNERNQLNAQLELDYLIVYFLILTVAFIFWEIICQHSLYLYANFVTIALLKLSELLFMSVNFLLTE